MGFFYKKKGEHPSFAKRKKEDVVSKLSVIYLYRPKLNIILLDIYIILLQHNKKEKAWLRINLFH